VLDKLQRDDEACFFGGDLNECFWPKKILNRAGFTDCFSQLGLPLRPTHPNRPVLAYEDSNADAVLDWIFARPAVGVHSEQGTVRALAATVVKDACGLSSDDPTEGHVLSVQPSDHCPVMAIYALQQAPLPKL